MGISVLSPASENGINSIGLSLNLDIVAIHGLNGDKFRTWTEPTAEKLWLRDFLPDELPRARVMTFGYNAAAAFENSKAGIREHARQLLISLMEKRECDSAIKRPLILLGHSLGGLVLKQALVIAQHEPLYRSIYSSVRGIIFFGTPHQGSSIANYATILARVPSILANKPRPQLLEALRKESGELKSLTEKFKRLLDTNSFNVVSFYETRTLDGWKALVVEKTSALLTPPNETPTYEEQIPVDATHREICRFSSREDETYVAAVRSIKRLYLTGSGADIKSEFYLVPNSVNPQFTGRTEICERLSELVVTREYADLQQRFVLHGMGGSGKTQICLKFAEDHRKRFWGVFWIDASTNETAQASFLIIARKCKQIESIEAVKSWIAAHSNWLLIIDNADDPSLDLRYYFPSGNTGTIIITTRNPELRSVASAGSYIVDEMEHKDAVLLLLKNVSSSQPEIQTTKTRQSAGEIVKILGHLALAIKQAGAVIRQQICTLDDFCEVYSQRKKDLLELGRSRPGMQEYQYSVFTTWEISLQKIKEMPQTHPALALELLRLFSFMHFDGIEPSTFQQAIDSCEVLDKGIFTSSLLVQFMPSGWDQILWGRAISVLIAFSLISVNESGSISLHPLVHDWSRERLSEDERKAAWETAAMTLAASITRTELTFVEYQQRRKALPHIDALLLHDNGYLFAPGDMVCVMPRSIAVEKFMMAYDESSSEKTLALALKNLTLIEPILYPDDQHRINLNLRIASHLHMVGRNNESIAILESLLEIATTNKDTNLFIVVSSRLAGNYIFQERYTDAKSAAELAIDIYTKYLDMTSTTERYDIPVFPIKFAIPHSPNSPANANASDEDDDCTLLSLYEILGIADTNLGQHTASLLSAERVFQGRLKIYGEKHTRTQCAMINLATALEGCGLFKRAWDLFEKVVGLLRENLGDEHRITRWVVRLVASFWDRCWDSSRSGGGGAGSVGGKERRRVRAILNGKWGTGVRRKAFGYGVFVLEDMCKEFGTEDRKTLLYMRGLSGALFSTGEVEHQERGIEVQERLVEILARAVEMGKWDDKRWAGIQRRELRRMKKVAVLRRVLGVWVP
ncbi:hypothetical protein ONS96_007307 [Cadophora gregata f. sp. sojae]|nr:hypothetical protein ONS96_007307 [Cadophora gregata f. sp. sojae]